MTKSLKTALLEKLDGARAAKLVGLSESEITAIQEKHAIALPSAYREFLSLMGRDDGGLFSNIILFPGLEKYRQQAYDMASQHGFELPLSAYVFQIDDSGFRYFCLDEGDDPPVYEYIEGRKLAEKIDDRFSAWLEAVLVD